MTWFSRNREASSLRRWKPSGVTLFNLAMLAFAAAWLAPEWRDWPFPALTLDAPVPAVSSDRLSADFALCHRGDGTNCVVDGDTFWFAGVKYRIADIDTPETHSPRCAAEAALGARATERLAALLSAGPFSLESGERASDRYGRALRIVTRDGASIGETLVAEGLARQWGGHRDPWC
ncbi:thermonuclease family protein [Sphingobium aromaticiconvertens]|uniref:thermonuclease family protein n=1 Tax=Sphingobium aromaticiconvertens TaxID=365341 RepID=UPI003AFB3C5B